MVNILDVWPKTEAPANTEEAWREMMLRRLESQKGFLLREKKRGFVLPDTPLDTSQGQEMLRILLFRSMEEVYEALRSFDPHHYYEELIDAFNFLHCASLLDDTTVGRAMSVAGMLSARAEDCWPVEKRDTLHPLDFFSVYCQTCLALGDFMRNRSWMERAQDVYFAQNELADTIARGSLLIMRQFSSFEDFWKYFIAKDEVLKFRLRSNY